MKQGYKQTEIGVIPEDWETVSFSKCFDTIRNNTLSRAKLNYDKGSIKNIHYGDVLINFPSIVDCQKETIPYVNEDAADSAGNSFLQDGDIVIADTAEDNTVGKAVEIFNIGDSKVVAGLHTMPCRPKNKFAEKILGYYINARVFHDQIIPYITGTKVSSISKRAIDDTTILVPPLAEQKRIAEALSDVDELIASLEKLIEKKKALKQGVMQELLTGKRRLPGFTGEWKSVSLEQIGVLSGSGVDKKVLPDEKPITLLNYTNVYHQTAISRKDLSHQVTASDKKIYECNVRKYDVFLTPTSETPNEIAFSAVAIEDMPDVVYSYHVIRLRPYDSFNGAYINYAMNMEVFRNQATMLAEGSGIRYVITLKKFKDMVVMVPCDLNEQNAIVQVLFDFENEIEKLSQKLIKARQIKFGMMSELLTGRIRLV